MFPYYCIYSSLRIYISVDDLPQSLKAVHCPFYRTKKLNNDSTEIKDSDWISLRIQNNLIYKVLFFMIFFLFYLQLNVFLWWAFWPLLTKSSFVLDDSSLYQILLLIKHIYVSWFPNFKIKATANWEVCHTLWEHTLIIIMFHFTAHPYLCIHSNSTLETREVLL